MPGLWDKIMGTGKKAAKKGASAAREFDQQMAEAHGGDDTDEQESLLGGAPSRPSGGEEMDLGIGDPGMRGGPENTTGFDQDGGDRQPQMPGAFMDDDGDADDDFPDLF